MRDIDLAGEATIATPAIAEATAASFGALLADRDVAEIGSLEGGSVDVLRRGRRERLDVILEGPLFALLREAGAETAVLTLKLPGAGPMGHELVAGPLADGRIALRIVKGIAHDATLESLIEEGVLPPGIDVELRAAVLEGAGVVVIGPARAARKRVLTAIVRALADRLAFYGVTDSLSALLPVPLVKGALLLEKARAAASLGCDAIVALDVTPREAADLARAELGVTFVVSVAVTSMDALTSSFGELSVHALAGTTAVIGHGPDGEARLVELHGPTRVVDEPTETLARPSSAPTSSTTPSPMVSRGLPPMPVARTVSADRTPAGPAEVSGLRARPSITSDDDIPPLAALPEGWASDHSDDDPGWELGETEAAPPVPGSFDAALASQKGKPSFAPRTTAAPRAPSAHPQTTQLKGVDPFGGLTFEPPPGGPVADDDDDDTGRGPR